MSFKKFIIPVSMLFFIQSTITYGNIEKNLVVSNNVNGLTISIDGRQELLSIVQYLGGYFRLNDLKLAYKTDVDNYFSDFKEHEAVKFVQKLTNQGFTYDAPPGAMLYFSNEFEVNKEFSEYLVKRAGGQANITEFARLIKKFAEDTKFIDFLYSQREFYDQIVRNFSTGLSDFHEIATLEEFYGEKQNSYNIILSILNAGNYGPKIETNGKYDVYNIMSAKKAKEGKPMFGDIKNIEYLVWHEFGHSFVNYLTYNNNDLVSKYKDLHEPIKEQMKKQAYGNWKTVINEHVIRAITVKMAEKKYGRKVANDLKYREIGRFFYYIEPLCKQLDIYIQNRDTYKTFPDFYPVLIKEAFDDALANNYLNRYLQNLNNTYKEIDYIVVTKDEKNESVQGEISEYIENLKKRFFKDTPVITDEEALKLNISDYSFTIYGTVKNNLLLQKFKNDLPVSVSDTCIHADKEYILNNGKAIFNLPNPLNRDNYFIVYTAQKPEGIININNVFHGPTNYIVFENRNTVFKSGYLFKEGGRWICR